MAAGTNNSAAAKNSGQGFVYLPLIAGWLVPGAGHFLVGKWGRGALLAVSIVSMYVLGLAMQGTVYSSAHNVLDILSMAGDICGGILYFICRAAGLGTGQITATVADYGSRFIVVAGLLNVIAAVDAHNLRTGRKAA